MAAIKELCSTAATSENVESPTRIGHNDAQKASPVKILPQTLHIATPTGKASTAAILAAAMSLPSLQCAHAETAPQRAELSVKYLDYLDSQPDANRIRIRAPAINVVLPFAGVWAINANYVSDAISGASPAFHTKALSSLRDLRRATDVRLTRYFAQASITGGINYSHERDYESRGLLLQGTVSTEDQNTTFNAGVSVNNDAIHTSRPLEVDDTKRVVDWNIGMTQVLTKNDLAQINLGYTSGRGYYSDPYKSFDERPRSRTQETVLIRWNHHIDAVDGTTRLSYRYYHDSFAIQAHTLGLEYVQPLPGGWTITPLVRLYTQTAARFYLGPDPHPDPAAPYLPTFPDASMTYFSEDQRLAAFGARTLGLKVSKSFGDDWRVDIKYEDYAQRNQWALGANESLGLAPFNAHSIQLGLTKLF